MEIANRIGEMLRARRLTLGTAESCTGGYIAHLITRVPGSSDYFLGSVVSYSNEVKARVLGVSDESLERQGAVSRQVVEQMADDLAHLGRFGLQRRHLTDSVRIVSISGRSARITSGRQRKRLCGCWKKCCNANRGNREAACIYK